MSRATQPKLEPGRAYRTRDLRRWSANPTRLARRLVDEGKLHEAADRVPDDAINQMHRFRDAITRRVGSAAEGPQRVRPVVGAFALYPGFFHQTASNMESDHSYFEEVEHVGIGVVGAPEVRLPELLIEPLSGKLSQRVIGRAFVEVRHIKRTFFGRSTRQCGGSLNVTFVASAIR